MRQLRAIFKKTIQSAALLKGGLFAHSSVAQWQSIRLLTGGL
jgi:hypothetical protein